MHSALDPVTAILRAYAQAILDQDAVALAALYHPDVRVFDAWDHWQIRGRAAVQHIAGSWFQTLGADRVVVGFSKVQHHAGPSLATISALVTYTAVGPQGARLRAQVNRISLVLQQAPDGWRVVHEHTSVPVGFADKQAVGYGAAQEAQVRVENPNGSAGQMADLSTQS